MTRMALLAGALVRLVARLVTAPRALWQGIEPLPHQRIYFANHASHGDFVLIWTTLPLRLRTEARPVAAADYWAQGWLKRWLIHDVFRGVLIERLGRSDDPLAGMRRALDAGDSLILFPEGTRNTGEVPLLPFKTGLYHLALAYPDVELVPVWIDNLNRVLPKGERVPLPLLCTLTYGAPLQLAPEEDKAEFLVRAERALLGLAQARGGERHE